MKLIMYLIELQKIINQEKKQIKYYLKNKLKFYLNNKQANQPLIVIKKQNQELNKIKLINNMKKKELTEKMIIIINILKIKYT